MWRAVFVLLLVAAIRPAFAITPVTVQELEQFVASAKSWPDKDAAQRLTSMELTERLSSTRLNLLKSVLAGEKSRLALLALSDASAFLDLPAADILKLPVPNSTDQGRIVSRAADFVVAAVSKMPDFFAARTTTRFQDLKVTYGLDQPVVVSNQGFHFIDRVSATVAYRDGREVVEPPSGKKRGNTVTSTTGLTNWGVFGPLLGVVMTDILKGKIGWGHWEQGPTGPLAVFRYAVAEDRSNYTVRYCCFRSETGEMKEFETVPAYHGEIAIDPESGAIFRLVLMTDLQPELPMERSDVAVIYGPVEIGGKACICPVESTSISKAEALVFHGVLFYADKKGKPDNSLGSKLKRKETLSEPTVTAINDVVFESYHQFRGDVHILSDDSPAPKEETPAAVHATAPELPPQN
jgi:hypothetical protein